jgi:hypothetical protein
MKKPGTKKKEPEQDINADSAPKKSKESKKNKSSKDSKKILKKIKPSKSAEIEVTPYREIEFSDGSGFYIKTACNLTSDNRVQVMQYREHINHEGTKFSCTEPIYFETKSEFLEWLVEMLKKNFDEIPYITIKPIESSEIKKHERETTDTMYL